MLRNIESGDNINFSKLVDPISGQEIVPCIAVDVARLQLDGLRAIRMVGFQNRDALDRTFETGLVTLFKRSTGMPWSKGETSGNTLEVIEVLTDCDQDAILINVRANGPTCHNGTQSCFEVKTEGDNDVIG